MCNEWKDIETAPKDGTHILAWFPDNMAYCLIYRSGDRWFEAADGYPLDDCDVPSEWQPLPAPPAAAVKP